MREEDIGKVFLFALPWDWTWVGRFVGFVGDKIELTEAGYFTRTGATFERLVSEGFTEQTQFHSMRDQNGYARINADYNVLLPWQCAWPHPPRQGGKDD